MAIRLMSTKAWQLPVRLATGAFILNSGLSKRRAIEEEHARQLKGMAATAYPQFAEMDSQRFVTLLSTAEIILGAALLAVPLVPPILAGLGLLGFSGGLNGLYLRVPGMREEGSVKPTPQGIPIAKDFWMTSIGLALVLDSVLEARRDR